jgi:hypothetical protein
MEFLLLEHSHFLQTSDFGDWSHYEMVMVGSSQHLALGQGILLIIHDEKTLNGRLSI